jgi:plasmid maintenance system antidote protein VapI
VDAHRRFPYPEAKGCMMKTIVDQLRKAIAQSKQTEYMVAKGSGVSQSVVNRFVHGERGISLDTAAKLCEYLGLKLTR